MGGGLVTLTVGLGFSAGVGRVDGGWVVLGIECDTGAAVVLVQIVGEGGGCGGNSAASPIGAGGGRGRRVLAAAGALALALALVLALGLVVVLVEVLVQVLVQVPALVLALVLVLRRCRPRRGSGGGFGSDRTLEAERVARGRDGEDGNGGFCLDCLLVAKSNQLQGRIISRRRRGVAWVLRQRLCTRVGPAPKACKA